MQITGEPKGTIEVKRLYLPGVTAQWTCPSCGIDGGCDYGNEYLNYPDMNKAFDLHQWCPECNHEWSVKVVLSVQFHVQETS